MKITYSKTPQGSLVLSAIVDGYLVERLYQGYRRHEATRLFRLYVKGNK